MNTPVIAFFNNKGGVGKTSLVYHIASMYSEMGVSVVAADLDPQANLTAMFFGDDLGEDHLEMLWSESNRPATVFGCIQPLLKGIGDVANPETESICSNLALLPGDLALSGFEDELSDQWPQCLDGKERAFRVLSAFWRILQRAAVDRKARVILVDLGPNLGAINRAALIACDYVVVPLSPDLFSLQGMKNLGPTVRRWRSEWTERLKKNPVRDLPLPESRMRFAGYVVLQHSVRLDRPVRAYDRWIARIPQVYRSELLQEQEDASVRVENDKYCLSLLKHYRSLMPLAQEAHKPIFSLRPADGAIGAHLKAVEDARRDFRDLAAKIAELTGVRLK